MANLRQEQNKIKKKEEVAKLHFFQRKLNNEKAELRSEKYFYNMDTKLLIIAAIVVIILGLFWLVYDQLRGSVFGLDNVYGYSGLGSMFICSLLVIIYYVLRKGENTLAPRIIYFLFDVGIIIGVTLIAISMDIHTQMQIDNSTEPTAMKIAVNATSGIQLSSCLLFIIAIAPLPKLVDSIIISLLLIVSSFAPALPFVPGEACYPLVQQIILAVCIVIANAFFYFKMTDDSRMYDEFEHIAFTDKLTNTLNRRALDVYWDSIFESNNIRTIGVIMFDIDDFKKYNDKYSHPEGDKILVQICRSVYESINKDRDLLFRYGGEEFIVLLPNTSKEELINRASSMRYNVIQQNIERDDGARFPYLTITIGCTVVGKFDDYISKVDSQLYIGKKGPKNCVVIDDKIVVR